MSRFKASDVIDELRAFENDYNDELECYFGVDSVEKDVNGDVVATVVFIPVEEDEEGDYTAAYDKGERFRVKVNRL